MASESTTGIVAGVKPSFVIMMATSASFASLVKNRKFSFIKSLAVKLYVLIPERVGRNGRFLISRSAS